MDLAQNTKEWRKLHNDELTNMYSTLNIVWVTEWRGIRWAEHVETYGGEKRHMQGIYGDAGGKKTAWETQV